MSIYMITMVACDAEGCCVHAPLRRQEGMGWFAVGEKSYCPLHATAARDVYVQRMRSKQAKKKTPPDRQDDPGGERCETP